METDQIQFSRKTVTMNDGATIALWDSGGDQNDVLVFVHGFPENHRCWDHLLSEIPRHLFNHYRFITYDLRGFGESSKTGHASIAGFYEDHQAVMAHLQISAYHFVGHDWGGALALQTARFNPNSIKSATVMNTSFWKTDLFGMWHLIFLNVPLLPKIVFKWFPERLFNFAMIKSFLDPEKLDPGVLQSYLAMFRDEETTAYWRRLYRSMARSIAVQYFPYLRRIFSKQKIRFPEKPPNSYRVDVMLVWGEDDRFAPVRIGQNIAENLVKRGAVVSFNTISEAGHFVQEDQPQKIVPLLLSHWKKTTSAGKGRESVHKGVENYEPCNKVSAAL